MVSYADSGEMTVDYRALRAKDYKGNDYKVDESLRNGPKEKRKCTDMLCCLAFIAILGLMCFWCITSYINGDPAAFVYPVSGDNSICGQKDTDASAYPYLYIPDLRQIEGKSLSKYGLYSCCIASCPTSSDSTISEYYGCDLANNSTNIIYATNTWHKYCVPIQDELPSEYTTGGSDLYNQYGNISLGSFVMSVYDARWVMLISIFIALILALGYIKFMDWCAYWLCWICVILSELSLILLGVAAYFEDQLCKNNSSCSDAQETLYATTMYVSFIFAVLYGLLLICKFKSLSVSIAVIETAADFFADSKRIIIVPIIYFILAIVVFCVWFFGVMCLASVGEITGTTSNQLKSVDRTSLINDRIAWMVIFYIWIATLIHALNEYTIIVSACTWYFSRKDIPDDDGIPGDSDIWKGFWWAYRYNFGSLALGSGILTLVSLIKGAVDYAGDVLIGASAGNPCTVCLMKCVDCYFDCFDRFIRYLTTNAYIYMAISGDSFCTSAIHAFLVVLKNAAEFSFVDQMAWILVLMAKFSIAILTTLAGWGLLKVWPDSYDDTDSEQGIMLPALVIFCLSYVIAAMFIGIFDVSSNTILMCYLWDLEICKSGGNKDSTHVPATLAKFLQEHSNGSFVATKQVSKDLGEPAAENLIS